MESHLLYCVILNDSHIFVKCAWINFLAHFGTYITKRGFIACMCSHSCCVFEDFPCAATLNLITELVICVLSITS